jgi:acyl-coenzyme A synthetase/AMP-(fatty) acid ligase
MQVAPTELESFLQQQPLVSEAAVVPVPDEFAGELPRAYIVGSTEAKGNDPEQVQEALRTAVAAAFPQHKHLAGGVELIDALPKTPSGKVLRPMLKDRAKKYGQERVAEATGKTDQLQVAVQAYTIESDDED